MFSWLSLLTLVLNVASSLLGWMRERQLLDAGADREIAKQALAILEMTQEGKRIMAHIQKMDDDELNDWLQELGKD